MDITISISPERISDLFTSAIESGDVWCLGTAALDHVRAYRRRPGFWHRRAA